jgi:hypothetical protein
MTLSTDYMNPDIIRLRAEQDAEASVNLREQNSLKGAADASEQLETAKNQMAKMAGGGGITDMLGGILGKVFNMIPGLNMLGGLFGKGGGGGK